MQALIDREVELSGQVHDKGTLIMIGLLGERSALKGDAGEMARRWDGATEPLGVDLLDGADLVLRNSVVRGNAKRDRKSVV